ncbi:MAG TPA: hypothetical protein VL899_02970 [Alphaproteobacteria bacterium]|nr:hypothetical protein [Alphaproteobacteria bacterium]
MRNRKSTDDYLFSIYLNQGRYSDPKSLVSHSAQVYSQNGEDGYIAEIFNRIGRRDKYFVEFGVEDGLQNNTRFLLEQGWSGVWVDGAPAALARARETFDAYVKSGRLKIIESFVSRDNVDDILDSAQIPGRFDFLSLDLDQNTSHVWNALRRHARVACIEYNASIPAGLALEVPYDENGRWDGTNWFGAGLKRLEQIGGAKSLSLVGCDLNGVNAFFVDSGEAVGKFAEPFISERHWEPPRYSHINHAGHQPSKQARRWLPSE